MRASADSAQVVRGDGSGVALPNRLPNPAALEIYLNGSSKGGYDGTTAKTINITSSSIGLGYVLNEQQFCASHNNIKTIWSGSFTVSPNTKYALSVLNLSNMEMRKYTFVRWDLGAGKHLDFIPRDNDGGYISAGGGFPRFYSGNTIKITNILGTIYSASNDFSFTNIYDSTITSGTVSYTSTTFTVYGVYGIGLK